MPNKLAQAVSLLQADGKSAQMLRLRGLRCEVMQTLSWTMPEQQHFCMWHEVQLHRWWICKLRAALLVLHDCTMWAKVALHYNFAWGDLCRSDCDACTDNGNHVQRSLLTHVQGCLASVVGQQHAG